MILPARGSAVAVSEHGGGGIWKRDYFSFFT